MTYRSPQPATTGPMRMLAFSCTVGLLAAQDPAPVRDTASLAPQERAALAADLKHRGRAPVEYLTAKLRAHDVVLLGEMHQVREDVAFVAGILAPLYRDAELRCLATEFLRRRHAERINAIVTAPDYDAAAVVDLFRDGPWPTWGFADYMDVFRAVWEINRSRQEGEEPLHVAPMDSEWSQHELWFGKLTPARRMQVLLERERTMVETVEAEAITAGRKTLVHVGFAHTVTQHGARLGTVLSKKHGARIAQVALHHEIGGSKARSGLTELFDEAWRAAAAGPLGFDIAGSCWADLGDKTVQPLRMLQRGVLAEYAQGYVILKPSTELGIGAMRWTPGFILPERFEQANAVAVRLGWVEQGECEDAGALDAKLQARFPPR